MSMTLDELAAARANVHPAHAQLRQDAPGVTVNAAAVMDALVNDLGPAAVLDLLALTLRAEADSFVLERGPKRVAAAKVLEAAREFEALVEAEAEAGALCGRRRP